MMGSEVRVSGDANARRRHVSFGDVTNIEVSSGATLKGTRNPADASLVPSTAAASRQGASVVAAFRKTSTPAVAPLRGTTPPPRHEGTAGAGCHTPPGRGGGGGGGG
ncbi:hypothetical protein DQ04_27241000, partial [Trypanosoma grayi]|uniref:hypothetical protein n=1 Tax=Trypanosoma grayi TaxID=71804 RepID=UPI0004F483EB